MEKQIKASKFWNSTYFNFDASTEDSIDFLKTLNLTTTGKGEKIGITAFLGFCEDDSQYKGSLSRAKEYSGYSPILVEIRKVESVEEITANQEKELLEEFENVTSYQKQIIRFQLGKISKEEFEEWYYEKEKNSEFFLKFKDNFGEEKMKEKLMRNLEYNVTKKVDIWLNSEVLFEGKFSHLV